MAKIAIIDTVYPEFLKTVQFDSAQDYTANLRILHDRCFGTFDAYSRHLTELGWECMDIVANSAFLQGKWAKEQGMAGCGPWFTVLDQIRLFRPDIIFLQDVGYFSNAEVIDVLKSHAPLAAQISCRVDAIENLKLINIIFTSLPHFVPWFELLGVKAVYLPLAFDPIVLQGPQPERDIDISFVGGAGRDSHWRNGTDTLEVIAERFRERFHWYGYGLDRLPPDSALRACYRGEAWGNAMYSIYRRSRMVANRHGEISGGYTNNLRCYEAAGCSTMLLTEVSPNVHELFPVGTVVPYDTPPALCRKIQYYLDHDGERKDISIAGHDHVLKNHTYAVRMKQVSSVLTGY